MKSIKDAFKNRIKWLFEPRSTAFDAEAFDDVSNHQNTLISNHVKVLYMGYGFIWDFVLGLKS